MAAQFLFGPPPDFWAEPKITVPGAESPVPIAVCWRPLGRKALRAWIDRFQDTDPADLLFEVLADWRIVDSEGRAIPLTRDQLGAFLDAYPAAGADLSRQYIEDLTRSRLGN